VPRRPPSERSATIVSAAEPLGFFVRRWRGEVPMRIVLWRDMLVWGTVLNVVVTFAALMLASMGQPMALAAAIHFAPLPYNLFLFVAVGRAAPRSRLATVLAVAWLVVMLVV
jgi:hypothetical protein